MRRYLALLPVPLFLAALLCFAQGQGLSMMGVGGYMKAPSGSSYTGPGDIVSGWSYWYGVRAFSAATLGNALVNVCNSTGGTDVGCADLSSNATTGNLVAATVGGITCPGANCTIKIWYDQSGNGRNATQATIASRASLTASCIGSLPCAVPPGTGVGYTATAINLSQPFSFSVVVRQGTYTANDSFFGADNASTTYGYIDDAGIDSLGVYFGSNLDATSINHAIFHPFAAVINSGSSVLYVDGFSGSGSAGSGAIANTDTIHLLGDGYGDAWPSSGGVTEAGIWPGGFTSTQAGNLCHNQFAYWGTGTSC